MSAFWRSPNSPSSGTLESWNYKQQTQKLLPQSRIRTVNYCCRVHILCILTPPLIESSTSQQTRAHWRRVPAPRLSCFRTPTFNASRALGMANVAFVGQTEEAEFPCKRLTAPPGFARPCLTPHGLLASVWSSVTHTNGWTLCSNISENISPYLSQSHRKLYVYMKSFNKIIP